MAKKNSSFSGPASVHFRRKLYRWYRSHFRRLPWRDSRSPYKIWVSEVMLQQTTVQAVLPYYQEWLRVFSDIESLSRAPLQKVLKTWEGLGYYQRARNMHRASKIIMKIYKGQIPPDYTALLRLPGFGPYISSAVLSFSFDMPYPVIDANVRRILMRMMRLQKNANPQNDKILIQHLTPFLPQGNMSLFNQAMMELGALVCKPKNPRCLLCPIIDFCLAYQAGEQEIIPRPQKRKYHKIETVIGIIKKQNRILIQKRPSHGLLADLWEFPGGKRKKGEELTQTLHREIKEELGAEVLKEKSLTKVAHAYTQFQVTLYAYECTLKDKPKLKKNIHRWVTLKGMHKFPMPSGSVKIVRFLEE